MKIRIALQKINMFVKQRYVFAIVLIALVLALAGSITGLSSYVYQYGQSSSGLADCSTRLNETQLSYSECSDRSSSLSTSLQNAQLQLSSCLGQVTVNLTQCLNEKSNLMNNNKELSDSFANCKISFGMTNVTLFSTQIEFDELKKDYNSLVGSTANSICCMKNSALRNLGMNTTSFYYVANNTIVCTDQFDETLNTKPFSC